MNHWTLTGLTLPCFHDVDKSNSTSSCKSAAEITLVQNPNRNPPRDAQKTKRCIKFRLDIFVQAFWVNSSSVFNYHYGKTLKTALLYCLTFGSWDQRKLKFKPDLVLRKSMSPCFQLRKTTFSCSWCKTHPSSLGSCIEFRSRQLERKKKSIGYLNMQSKSLRANKHTSRTICCTKLKRHTLSHSQAYPSFLPN